MAGGHADRRIETTGRKRQSFCIHYLKDIAIAAHSVGDVRRVDVDAGVAARRQQRKMCPQPASDIEDMAAAFGTHLATHKAGVGVDRPGIDHLIERINPRVFKRAVKQRNGLRGRPITLHRRKSAPAQAENVAEIGFLFVGNRCKTGL